MLPAGLTVQGIIETVAEGVAFDVELVRRDAAALPHSWPVRPEVFAQVRPTPGTVVRVRPRVRAAVVPALAGWLASATGLSLVASQIIVGVAISAAAYLASSLLFGVQANPADRRADKLNPTINGLQNTFATRGQPVPLPLGRIRMAPVRVATGYSDLVGQKVYRRERMVFGPGPLALHDLKIGETPVHRFDGVKIQLRNIDEAETLANYPQLADVDCTFLDDGDTMTLYRRTIFEDVDGARLETDVAEVRDTPEQTVAANVQIYFAGLVKFDQDNNRVERQARIEVAYRPAAGGDWVVHSSNWYTGETTSTLRFGERIEFPEPGSWSIRVTRLNPDDDRTNVQDDAYLEAIQSEIEGTMPSPPGLAEIAIRVKATEQLSGSLDPINAVVQQMARVWNGSNFSAPQPIRHPADIYVALLRGDYRKAPLANARIDLAGIKAWKDAWPNWRCDMVVSADKRLGDLVREVLATGLAVPTQTDGKHGLIYDRADQPAVQVFSPRNTADYSARWQAPPEVHAFRLTFPSERASWTDDEITIYANGYDAETATKIETLEPPGLALAKSDSITRLAQWAYYHLAQVKTRTTEVSFTTDLDHLVCSRGDPVIFVSDALRNVLASGRLTEVTTALGAVTGLRLDDAPDMEGFSAHVMVRSSSGALQYVTATMTSGTWAVAPGSGVRVQPAGAFDDTEFAAGDLAFVFEYDTEPQTWLVAEIAPEFGERARVTLTEATSVPLDDMNRPLPEYDPRVITRNEVTNARFVIEYDAGQMYVRLLWYTLDPAATDPFRVILLDGTGAEIANVQTADRSTRFPVQSAFPETLTATIQGWQETQSWGEGRTLTISTASQFAAPGATSNFQGQVMGEVLYLTWARAADNVDYHVIRYNPATSGATWATSVPIVPTARGEQATVPAQNGTYLIKPVTFQGAEAATAMAVTINSASPGLNAVETLALAPGFDGTGDNGLVVYNGALVFASDAVIADWPTLAAVGSIFTYGRDTLAATFTLDDFVDLGAVDTARVTAAVSAVAYRPSNVISGWSSLASVANIAGTSDGEWSVIAQVSTTEDDPGGSPVWTAWDDLVVSDYRARAWRFRLLFEVTDPGVVIEVADLAITVDMQDRIEKAADIAVPTGGVTVTFDPPFRAVPAIVVDAQGLPAGGRSVKSAVSAAGFTLHFIDSGGGPVAGTADYTAVGYGRQGA